MKSLDLIQQEILKDIKNQQSSYEKDWLLMMSKCIDSGKWKSAYYCTKCKKTFIKDTKVDNNDDTPMSGRTRFISSIHEEDHHCQNCKSCLPLANKSAEVKNVHNIIKRSDNKLSIYNWKYTPEIVWPKKNKKPSILRILHVDGLTIGANGCYKWKFSKQNGKRVHLKHTKKRTRAFLRGMGQSLNTLHNNFDDSGSDMFKKFSAQAWQQFLGEISPAFLELRLHNYLFPLSKRVFDAARGGTKTLIKAILGRNESSLIKEIAQQIGNDRTPNWTDLYFVCRHIKDINILRKSIDGCFHGRNEIVVRARHIHIRDNHSLITILARKKYDAQCKILWKSLSQCFSKDKVIKFICSAPSIDIQLIRDARAMFDRLDPEEKVVIIKNINDNKTWTVDDLHRECADFINKDRKAQEQKPFHYDDEFKKYELDKENVKIILPKSPEEILKWGNELHNCVYSYANYIREKQSIILGLFINDKLMANVEVIRQARGFDNLLDNLERDGEIERSKFKKFDYITQFRGINNTKVADELCDNNQIVKEWVDKHKLTINSAEKEKLASATAREYQFAHQQGLLIERVI